MKFVTNVIEKVDNGVTEPLYCILDDGYHAIVKTSNNPQGNLVLFNELLCYNIACKIGLPMPNSGICTIGDKTKHNGEISEDNFGKAFYSERLNRITRISGSSLYQKANNHDIMPKLIVFDHLVYNADRNPGNLLYSMEKNNREIIVIDHTHVFHLGSIWNDGALFAHIGNDLSDDFIFERNRAVYDYYLNSKSIEIDELLLICNEIKCKIDRKFIQDIIETIPDDWCKLKSDLKNIEEYIIKRLENLDTICRDVIHPCIKKGVSII